MVIFMTLINVGIPTIISSNILSSSGTPTVQILVHLMVFHRSVRLSSLFFNIFFFLFSDLIIFIVLYSSLLILFFCANLPLNLSSEFFI